MDQRSVRMLEDNLERAVGDVVARLSKGRQVPLHASHHTVRMMAKAACAVYEAAVAIHEAGHGGEVRPE